MKKRFISVLLALMIALSLCTGAFAAYPGMDNFEATKIYGDGVFSDVSADDWYRDPVAECYEYGLMDGKDAGVFDPDGGLTIAEAIVMADQINSIYFTGAVTKPSGDPWYAGYVEYAVDNGIIDAGDFYDYDVGATRAQMAYIFANALPDAEYGVLAAVQSVPDVAPSDEYAYEIYKLYDAGILSGVDIYGTFLPNSDIRRCEAAVILRCVALQAERSPAILLVDNYYFFDYDTIGVAMPEGTAEEDNGGARRYYCSDMSGYESACDIAPETSDAEAERASLVTESKLDEFADQLKANTTREHGGTLEILSGDIVHFGDVPSFRYYVLETVDGVSSPAYFYYFVIDSTSFAITISSADAQMTDKIDSSLTVNGYYYSFN